MYRIEPVKSVTVRIFREANVRLTNRINWLSLLTLSIFSSGCASSTVPIGETPETSHDSSSFSNFLVLAIADNYTSRAQFERTVVSELKKRGASGTPYYEAVGGNKPISRESVREVLSDSDFDAVLVTRVMASDADLAVKADSAATKVTRRDKKPVDFFRYNYEELSEPGSISIRTTATLATDLYAVKNEQKVWSLEVSSPPKESVGHLIDEVSIKIVRQLQREKLIAK